MLQDFVFNGIAASSKGLLVKKFLSIPTAKEKISSWSLPGMDGSLYRRTGKYEDISIPIDVLYQGPETSLTAIYRLLKQWLCTSGEGRLLLKDDPCFYYRVRRVVCLEKTVLRAQTFGCFTITFTCLPHQYAVGGDMEIQNPQRLINLYDTAWPIYRITGEGVCKLEVNGNEMLANIGQELIINTEKMLAYREDGTLQNTAVTGDYEKMVLQPGENEISVSQGFELHVMPFWRCL